MKKTTIALAILGLFVGSAGAQEWTWESVTANDTWTYEGDGDPNVGGILHIADSLGDEETLHLKAAATSPQTVNGLHSMSASVTNNGLIYVEGGDSDYSMVGMTAGNENGYTATNNGAIFVDSQNGAQVSAIGTTPNGKVVNTGVINVRGENSYGVISWSGTSSKPVAIENSGTIIADGEGSTAIRVGDSVDASQEGDFGSINTITNTGNVLATNGAKAIVALGDNTSVTLSGDSNVQGVVEMGTETDLIIALDADNQNTQLELVGTDIRSLTLTDSTVEFTGDQQSYSFDKITANGSGNSEIRLVGNQRTLRASDVNGTLGVYSDHAGDGTTPVVDLGGVSSSDSVSVTFGGSIADSIGSASDVNNFFSQNVSVKDESNEDGAYTGKIEETTTTGEITYVVDENGNTSTTFTTATVADSTKELAALNAMAWRTELSTLTDRMGAIRTRPSDLGAWVRYNGGKLSKDDAWGELKMNTVELGFDMPVGQSSWVLGASFSYGDGDGEFEAGMTDNKKYTLGLYATYMNDSGCFLDIMAKIGQVQSDFNFATTTGVADDGDIDQMGYIFGIEAGHRFSGETLFIEPQIGLVYSYLDSESTTTQTREVDLDSVESLIGRAGIMFGGNFAQDRASVYGKAFVAHDFKGDVDGRARALSNGAQWRSFSQELAGTWGEFGIGGSYRVTDSASVSVDLSKTVGGDIDEDYIVNFAARYTF